MDASDGKLALRDSSGSFEQQWKIVSAGTHDGYYYFYPRSASSSALTNFSASPTANGAAGLGNAAKSLNCQFAFCFDSRKVRYAPIEDESDGSYEKWIESKGYTKVDLTEVKNPALPESELRIFVEENRLLILSPTNTNVSVYSVDGRLVLSFEAEADVASSHELVPGVYVVNGKSVVVGL